MSDKMESALQGATAMLIFVLVLWFTYALGAGHGRLEIRMQAVEHGKGQYRVVGDPSSEFSWFK